MNIQLLDGSKEPQKDLLAKMYDDHYYYGELNQKALSSISIKLLVDSPKKYYFVQKYGSGESQGMRDGRLLHTLVLEPEKFEQFNFVEVASKNSKAYKEAKAEHGVVYTSKERSDAERLADALLRNEKATQILQGAEFEKPIIGHINGHAFRGKADIVTQYGGICDIKTTTDIKAFKYSANKYGYDLQCYIYCQLFDINFRNFQFLVLDKASLDIGVFDVSEEFYLRGKAKTELGIQRYEEWFMNKEADLDNYYIEDIL